MNLRDVTAAAIGRVLDATTHRLDHADHALTNPVGVLAAWRAEVDTEPAPVLPADVVADAIQAGAR